jgi:hypothetical protein
MFFNITFRSSETRWDSQLRHPQDHVIYKINYDYIFVLYVDKQISQALLKTLYMLHVGTTLSESLEYAVIWHM